MTVSFDLHWYWWMWPILIVIVGYFCATKYDAFSKNSNPYITDEIFFGSVLIAIGIVIGHIL